MSPDGVSNPLMLSRPTSDDDLAAIRKLGESCRQLKAEISKAIIGQETVVDDLLTAIFSRGHCLMIGGPGLPKTLMVSTSAKAIELDFNRIQFTPDLMPADITGTEILEEAGDGTRRMQFVKGPIFANVILADEINRTPPKTQAALLEAMQEHQVTAAGVCYPLDEPFFVLATQNPIEMDMKLPDVVAKLNAIEGYRKQFQQVFGTEVTSEGIGRAIASFERTVLSADAPFDRFKIQGDDEALSAAAKRGLDVFFNKAHCSACHTGGNFADGGFHNIGIGMDKEKFDPGREEITKRLGDRGSFKTPTLREIARTAPYMHDGSLATLGDVIDYYDRGGIQNPQLDEEMSPLSLSDHQK